jgi:hypothetical protein
MRYEIRGNGSVSFANHINHLPDPPRRVWPPVAWSTFLDRSKPPRMPMMITEMDSQSTQMTPEAGKSFMLTAYLKGMYMCHV